MGVRTAPQFAVNDAGDPEPVILAGNARKVTIKEDPHDAGWPREWILRAPLATSDPVNKGAGESHVFDLSPHEFGPGKIIGYAETKSTAGATTFNQYEE